MTRCMLLNAKITAPQRNTLPPLTLRLISGSDAYLESLRPVTAKLKRFSDVTDHPDAVHRRHESFHVIDVWPFRCSYGDEADLHNRWNSCWTAWDAREVSHVRAKNASGQRETLQLNRSYGNEANLH
jgi:hypothetical protein